MIEVRSDLFLNKIAVVVGGHARSPHAPTLTLQPTDYSAARDPRMTGTSEVILELPQSHIEQVRPTDVAGGIGAKWVAG